MRGAFENYVKNNGGRRPEQICVYRDGVGGPTFQEHVVVSEGPGGELQTAIKAFAPNYNPKILYVLLNKRVQTRLFERVNNEVINPGPGTCVDTAIVENDGSINFDFFMIANDNPKTATALPVHYQVVMNTTGMSKQEI